MGYKESRNIEASIIDWIVTELSNDGWKDINVYKVFAQVYKKGLPAILINVNNIDTTELEIGSKRHLNLYTIYFRIFANSDGNRLDLSDWLLEELEDDIDYFEYIIDNGIVSDKILKGRIAIRKILRNERELVNTEGLEKEDRYRQLITVQCYLALFP